MKMRGHPAGGEREKHVGDDAHGTGSSPEGAPGQNHPDHRVLAGQPAVNGAPKPSGTAFIDTDRGMWKAESFGPADHPKLAVWEEKLRTAPQTPRHRGDAGGLCQDFAGGADKRLDCDQKVYAPSLPETLNWNRSGPDARFA